MADDGAAIAETATTLAPPREETVGVTLVEWSALSGDQVETLLANLIYNHDGRAVRIRPSQGDAGLDIVIPSAADPKKWDVYQVKKFASNLTAQQKGQVEKSFRSVLVGMVRRQVPLNDWYLVLPLDPTPENFLEWFGRLPEEQLAVLKSDTALKVTDAEYERIEAWLHTPGRIVDWKGLPFCESLVAESPYVVDYYLHGGAQRIKDAVVEVAKLLQKDTALRETDSSASPGEGSAALLQPGEIREHLLRLDRVLDTDPHYRYGHSLDLNRPSLETEPDLVAATQESIPGGRWLTFKIYARSEQSLDERPIPMKMKFQFEEDHEEHQAFKDWVKYGKPFEASATFDTDLPGGLEVKSLMGRVRVSPADREVAPFRNRQRIVAPDGTVLAELGFTVTSTTGADGTGTWARAVDDTGLLISESTLDATDRRSKIKFTLEPLAGEHASKALPVVTFASHVAAPNTLQVAGEYGPFFDYSPLPQGGEPLVPRAMVKVVSALVAVQSRTGVPVLIPDFSGFTKDEVQDLRRAAALIEGEPVVRSWSHFTFERNPGALVEPGMHFEVMAGDDLKLPKITGDQVLALVQKHFASVTVEAIDGDQVSCVPYELNTMSVNIVESLPDAPPGKKLLAVRPID